jgi:septal ring factor EnvC (AmiA/AmiB activator)
MEDMVAGTTKEQPGEEWIEIHLAQHEAALFPPEPVLVTVTETQILQLTSNLVEAKSDIRKVKEVVDSLTTQNNTLKHDCEQQAGALAALQHEKEALEAQCAALSIELKDKKEGEAMLLQLMESNGNMASNAKHLHDKTVADLTEAKLAHRSEVNLLRTELVDALEAQDVVQQEKDGQVQEISEAAVQNAARAAEELAESTSLRLHAEEAAAQYQSLAEKAESEAASLREEMARMVAEQLEPEPGPGPEPAVASRESEFRQAVSSRESTEEKTEDEVGA